MENLTFDGSCKVGVDVVTYPYYRTMQIFHIVLSTLSVILVVWPLKEYRKKFIFHYNIRILFVSLFLGSLLHSSLLAIFQSYQLYLSFTFVNECDIILSRYFYVSFHIPFVYSILWIETTQVVMLIERTIATLYVSQYEACTKKLGNSLFLICILMPFIECVWTYEGEPFDSKEINCLYAPTSRTKQINILFFFSLSFHIMTLIAMAITFYINKRKTGFCGTLSSKFQFSENVTSSRFLMTLSGLQLVLFLAYGCGTMYLRMTFNASKDYLPIYKSNILATYLVPVYTFLLPLMIMAFLHSTKQNRCSEIRSMIEVKAVGAEGWANYLQQLQQQWKC